jgi:hypothetical protein
VDFLIFERLPHFGHRVLGDGPGHEVVCQAHDL